MEYEAQFSTAGMPKEIVVRRDVSFRDIILTEKLWMKYTFNESRHRFNPETIRPDPPRLRLPSVAHETGLLHVDQYPENRNRPAGVGVYRACCMKETS